MSLDTLTSQPMPIRARRHGDVVQVRGNGREINLPVAHLGGGRLALRLASEGVPTHNETLAACEALSNHATEEVLVVLDRTLWCAREAQLLKSGCLRFWMAIHSVFFPSFCGNCRISGYPSHNQCFHR